MLINKLLLVDGVDNNNLCDPNDPDDNDDEDGLSLVIFISETETATGTVTGTGTVWSDKSLPWIIVISSNVFMFCTRSSISKSGYMFVDWLIDSFITQIVCCFCL